MSLTAFNRLRRVQAEAEKVEEVAEKIDEIKEDVQTLTAIETSEEPKDEVEEPDTATTRRNNRRASK